MTTVAAQPFAARLHTSTIHKFFKHEGPLPIEYQFDPELAAVKLVHHRSVILSMHPIKTEYFRNRKHVAKERCQQPKWHFGGLVPERLWQRHQLLQERSGEGVAAGR